MLHGVLGKPVFGGGGFFCTCVLGITCFLGVLCCGEYFTQQGGCPRGSSGGRVAGQPLTDRWPERGGSRPVARGLQELGGPLPIEGAPPRDPDNLTGGQQLSGAHSVPVNLLTKQKNQPKIYLMYLEFKSNNNKNQTFIYE